MTTTDRWTDKMDSEGDQWNDLLNDWTGYAKSWERQSGHHAREHAQYCRNERWKALDKINQLP